MQVAGNATGDQVLVLDNGGGYIRAGLATGSRPSVVEPNCSALARGRGEKKIVVGSEVLDLPSYSLYRPMQRGLLLDLDQQQTIWESIIDKHLELDPRECAVLATETPFTPASVRREMEEIFFETFGFKEVKVMHAPTLALHSPGISDQLAAAESMNPCCTVLSLGHSASIALPCVEGQLLESSVRRLNVGGRVLTNLMLERLNLRHYELGGNWLLAEDILQKVGEVSPNFDFDLRTDYARVAPKTYVLPDFQCCHRGFLEECPPQNTDLSHLSCTDVASDARLQRVTLIAERVAVPEMLFSPQDHGVRQAGLADLVQQAIFSVKETTWRPHFGRIVLCGGLARLPGLVGRLRRELRQLLPSTWQLEVLMEEEPELSVWRGAARLALSPEFRDGSEGFCSRQAWEEAGGVVRRNGAKQDSRAAPRGRGTKRKVVPGRKAADSRLGCDDGD